MRLYDAWAMHDIEINAACPDEIAEGKPGLCFSVIPMFSYL